MTRRGFLKSAMVAAVGAGLLTPAPLVEAISPTLKKAVAAEYMAFTSQDLLYANYMGHQIWAGLLEANFGKAWGERYRVRVLSRFKETEEGLIEVEA